jgi:hypothetical protein
MKSKVLMARVKAAENGDNDRFSKPITLDFASCLDRFVKSA